MKLTHLGISHFRSIGPEPVMIDLTKKITILVGQNDCGKSNVLRGVECVTCLRPGNSSYQPKEIDHHQRKASLIPKALFRVNLDDQQEQGTPTIGSISLEMPMARNREREATSAEIDSMDFPQSNALAQYLGIGSRDIHLWMRGTEEQRKMRLNNCLRLAGNSDALIPNFSLVPQFRKIESNDQYSIDGKGVIKLLSHWQHPEIGQDALRNKFDQVEKLLRDLLDRPNVTLEVPHTHKEILVHDTKSGLRLPLESHGTGIHQLIILAIAVLSEDDALYGIEEPEIHLHPVLQKRFLKFLREETTGRYIITTHSPVLIAPAEDVDVIHLKMVDGVTIPRRIETDAGTLEALEDLGIRPSDLLQANSVIWVEGPSDRTYIKRWLELLAPDLTEGIDYSIMFYGGRLLSHLSMDREVDALVKLLRINQRSAVVMDSDRKKSGDELNDTKKRIIAECETSGVHSWVTLGREIENYLTQRVVEAVIAQEQQPLQDRFKLTAWGSFGDHFAKMVGNKAPSRFDYDSHKPAWAHRFAAEMTETDLSKELWEEVRRLADFIRRRRPEA